MGALRRMRVSPERMEAQLLSAGFEAQDVAPMLAAIEAEIGRRFAVLVRTDGLQIVRNLARDLDRATRGDGQALAQFEGELFGGQSQVFMERLRLAGADVAALERAVVSRDQAAVRQLLHAPLMKMREVVLEQLSRIESGGEGVDDAWGSAYLAFETSILTRARALGIRRDPRADLKHVTVLRRAIHRTINQQVAAHRRALDDGRAVFDLAMGLAGYPLLATTRGALERRSDTLDAERRAVTGNGTVSEAREARTEEVVGVARNVGETALGSLVGGLLNESIAELGGVDMVADNSEALADRVFEKLQQLPIMTPDRETVRLLVRAMIDKAISEARGDVVPTDAFETALGS